MVPVPHDPANRARLSYEWRDERYHLLDEPEPTVVLNSNTLFQSKAYSSVDAAEAALWDMVVTTILNARAYVDPYAVWPGVEIAAVADPDSRAVHVVERSPGVCKAWRLDDRESALLAFLARVRLLVSGEDPVPQPKRHRLVAREAR